MTTIERAIRLYTEMCESDTNDDIAKLALEALQEKQERDNPQPLTLEQLKIINADADNIKWVYKMPC